MSKAFACIRSKLFSLFAVLFGALCATPVTGETAKPVAFSPWTMLKTAVGGMNRAGATAFAWVGALFTVMVWESMSEVSVFAAEKLGVKLKNFQADLENVYNLLMVIAMLIGAGLAIAGIIKLTKSSREEGGFKAAIMFIGAGALLLAVPALLLSSSASMMGENAGNEKLWKNN